MDTNSEDDVVATGSGGTDSIETLTDAMQPDAGEESSQETSTMQTPTLLRSGVDPAEAARIRWQRDRERQAEAAESETHARQDETVIVRTTVATGQILKRLEGDAKKGNTQAARELRAWLSELPIETDTDISALDMRTRQALLARLLDEIEEAA